MFLYSVATAAYRTACNREEILQTIQSKTGINVKILSKKEEADATLWGYICSTKYKQNLLKSNIILIDQGGVSTEISFFKNDKLIESKSLGVGVTALQNRLYSFSDLALEDALEIVDTYSIKQMRQYLNSLPDIPMNDIYCIGVGKSIQWAAGKNNKEQHDKNIFLEKICDRLDGINNKLENYTVAEIRKNTDAHQGSFPSDLDMRLGLPMIIELMKHCKIQNIHVSGTGLWYGIFFKKLYEIK